MAAHDDHPAVHHGAARGATEAPPELHHHDALAADDTVTDALLVPPTAQHQGAAIRKHDPCVS